MACASSSTARRHEVSVDPGHAEQRAVAGDDQIHIAQGARVQALLSSAAGIADGCATSAFNPGAKRSISAAQFASSEAGATSRLGCGCRARLALENEQQRKHLDGLAESHVVGQARAQAEFREEIEPAHAHLLIRPQGRLSAHRRDPLWPILPGCAGPSTSPRARGRRPPATSRRRHPPHRRRSTFGAGEQTHRFAESRGRSPPRRAPPRRSAPSCGSGARDPPPPSARVPVRGHRISPATRGSRRRSSARHRA